MSDNHDLEIYLATGKLPPCFYCHKKAGAIGSKRRSCLFGKEIWDRKGLQHLCRVCEVKQ